MLCIMHPLHPPSRSYGTGLVMGSRVKDSQIPAVLEVDWIYPPSRLASLRMLEYETYADIQQEVGSTETERQQREGSSVEVKDSQLTMATAVAAKAEKCLSGFLVSRDKKPNLNLLRQKGGFIG